MFHSFGLTGGADDAAAVGHRDLLYPSPLHYRIVPELVYDINATILFGTDTFLAGYARFAHPYDFYSLRSCSLVPERGEETRRVWSDKFGMRILEGYGVTETAPVLAMNTPMANRAGTVGRLSPDGVPARDAVPGIEEGGRLLVRGPNVMLGYLRADKPGVLQPAASRDGWHDTGDIVAIDAAGFIRIKGRAKRFAKIAGEMVSLSTVEAMAATLWPQAMSVAVSLPDARKGERIMLLTTQRTPSAAPCRAKPRPLARQSSPAGDIRVVDKIPLLGSGKTDYVARLRSRRSSPRPQPKRRPRKRWLRVSRRRKWRDRPPAPARAPVILMATACIR